MSGETREERYEESEREFEKALQLAERARVAKALGKEAEARRLEALAAEAQKTAWRLLP